MLREMSGTNKWTWRTLPQKYFGESRYREIAHSFLYPLPSKAFSVGESSNRADRLPKNARAYHQYQVTSVFCIFQILSDLG